MVKEETDNFMKKILFILCLSCFGLISCKSPESRKRGTIMVTIEPLRYFAEQIAGKKFNIETMVRPGNSPEDYEPTPRQMVELSHSLLYIKVGNIGFEQIWMRRLQKNVPHLKIIDSSKGITQAYSAPGVPDPHTWMSCKNARIISENIYHALVDESPQDSIAFRKNLERMLKKINQTDHDVRVILQLDAHRKSKAFVIYHPILTYYARDYHLTQLPMEQDGREPSAKEMQDLVQKARKLHVRTIFIQRQFSPRNAMTIALATKAQPENIDPLNYDWREEMLLVARSLQ